jgi:hypothetical protein
MVDDAVRSEIASVAIASEEGPSQLTPWQDFVTIESHGLAMDLMELYAVDAASIWATRHSIEPLATEQERNDKRGRWTDRPAK